MHIVLEIDIPLLMVNIPEFVMNKKINLNDDIKVDINCEENPDNGLFNLILLYNYEIV